MKEGSLLARDVSVPACMLAPATPARSTDRFPRHWCLVQGVGGRGAVPGRAGVRGRRATACHGGEVFRLLYLI